jgi:sterol desaturase/sphingolipid hydroxylase (fatty acid hydroxylase superfamily)
MPLTFFETFFTLEKSLLLFVILFFLRFPVLLAIENKLHAYEVKQKKAFWADAATAFFYTLIIFPLALQLSNWILTSPLHIPKVDSVPVAVRIFLYFVVGDFFHYWIHRLMHLQLFWRVHMWHHSPAHMSWLAGFRATLFDAILVNFAFILAWPLLGGVSEQTKLLLLLLGILVNDWMHLNIRLRFRFLEKFFITPRYHHIHHSTNMKLATKNFAAIFPIWDKIFGTYVDPSVAPKELTFGLSEKRSTLRLISGV